MCCCVVLGHCSDDTDEVSGGNNKASCGRRGFSHF